MTLGRLILPALRWSPETGFRDEELAVAAALEAGAGGFILFGGTATDVRELTDEITRRAGRPLLIASDLERGAGQQVAGLTELPPPRALAALDDMEAIRWAGAVTGAEARSVGINWVFAPVADLDLGADNPIVQTRAFGDDPEQVSRCVRAWIEGCQAAGALACAKHYPGHGRTTRDSHISLPEVDAPASALTADERPFVEAVRADVGGVMTAHVAYPALDRLRLPATLSPRILGRLRRELGFDGLVVSDALIMDGALVDRSEAEASIDALRAGVDLLLYPRDVRGVRAALEHALAAGILPAERVAEAQRRYAAALARVAHAAATPPRGPYDSADLLADALLDQGLARGTLRSLPAPIECAVVDDDLGGPYPPSGSGFVQAELARRGVAGSGGARVVLAFAEPRAWKGRAGFGPEARAALAREAPAAALVVLFGHPRLLAEIPGNAPVLVAWHRQRLMQLAVARWLAARA